MTINPPTGAPEVPAHLTLDGATSTPGRVTGTWRVGSPWKMSAELGAVVMSRLQRRFLRHAQQAFADGPRELFDLQMGRLVLARTTATALCEALQETVREFARPQRSRAGVSEFR